MTGYDGPTLRAVREGIGVPLRRIARTAGMSHGHLSKVERGEHGRPVTPAIISAYERVTGVPLSEAVASVVEPGEGLRGRRGRTWKPGQLTDIRRRGFNAAVAALSVGGPLGEPYHRLLDATGRPLTPTPPALADVAQLEQVGELFTTLDLRYGGGLVSQLSKIVLRWAVPMLDTTAQPVHTRARLAAAVSILAGRAAWAAFDMQAHDAARGLFRLALCAAVRAADPNLRGLVLADVAAQHNHLGYHQDCLEVIRLGEGDERIAPPVRMVLHGVKARGYAAIADEAGCRHQIQQAQDALTRAGRGAPASGWMARVANPAHLHATTGHAMAVLASRSGRDADRDDAHRRLAAAVDAYDPVTHARGVALCATRLAVLHLTAGETAEGAGWARRALDHTTNVTSSRLLRALATVRKAAAAAGDDATARELITDIDTVVTPGDQDDRAQPTPSRSSPIRQVAT